MAPFTGSALGSLHILMVEDSAEDAELIQDQLLEAGIVADFVRVEDPAALSSALDACIPDVVLSDLSLPGFSGYSALEIVRQRLTDVPFIFLSGTMGEEQAVRALQRGADDYVLKQAQGRLPTAVARCVRESRSARERARIESELLRSQRLESMSLLAVGLSHDLRNLLQPLLIVPDLMRSRSKDPRMLHLADVIAECGQRGYELAESMLSFVRGSRQESERIVMEELFQAVRLLLGGSLRNGITLVSRVSDPALAVEGNFTELQQVLLNLGLNAIQAMPDGGELRYLAEPVRDLDGSRRLSIRVYDQGTGMAPEVQEKLFSAFFTTKSGGTGLGLMSCKRIVDGMGGSIHVESRLGEGTRIDLLLPLPTDAPRTVPQRLRYPVGAGQRVLVVETTAGRRGLLGNALGNQGYTPVLARDGADALLHVQQAGLPDAVLIDSSLSLLGAPALVDALAKAGYTGPVIVLQDAKKMVDPPRWSSGPTIQIMRKPLELRHLLSALHDLLSGR